MRIGTITRLWRYPVKSMDGETLATARLTWRGMPGDRGWAVYDETREGVTSAKRVPPLRGCAAAYVEEPAAGEASPPARLTLPDGTTVRTDSPEAARRLSALAGRPLSLRALGSVGADAPPRVSAAQDTPEESRALMGLRPDEPLPDLSAFTPERLRLLRQGNYFDAFPLHLLTTTTLATLARRAPESVWDVRRFRPNVFVEPQGGGEFPELGWVGRRLHVGGAIVEVVMGCPRCVMVTLPVGDDVPQDHRVMRTLVRESHHTAGVYASIVAEGDVRVGDAVAIEA
jgi:hypothetical protein